PGSSRGRCSMCSVSSARRGACRGPAPFCWCTRTRCTSTSISSRGQDSPSSMPRCSTRPRRWARAAGGRSRARRYRSAARHPRRRPIQSGGGRALATAAGWLLALLLLLPHLTLGLVSLVPYGTWTTEAVPPVLSLVNYQRLFGEPERLRPLVNSLWMAAASTAAAVVLALVAGTLVGRRRPGRIPWRGPIDGRLALPWALPGPVFAVALATTFSVQHRWALGW